MIAPLYAWDCGGDTKQNRGYLRISIQPYRESLLKFEGDFCKGVRTSVEFFGTVTASDFENLLG